MLTGAFSGLVVLVFIVALSGLGESPEGALTSALIGAIIGLRMEFALRSAKAIEWQYTTGDLLVVITIVAILLGMFSVYRQVR